MGEGDALAGGAEELEAPGVVRAMAEGGCEGVVVVEGGGEARGYGGEWVVAATRRRVGVGAVDVGTDVAEGDAEVRVGVEVGEREGVCVMEGRGGRED